MKPACNSPFEGPYGSFDFLPENSVDRSNGSGHQIWVAGGIGITPFLARLGELARTNKAQQMNGDLFYCTPSRQAGDFPSQLEPLCQAAGIKLHCRQTDQDGPLSAQEVKACLQPTSSVWFCGPAAWGTALGKSLIAHGLPETAFHREAFEFR